MNEQTSNPTSGQNVSKSKFRRKSRQEQTAASKLRMERRGELDAAREKLAKQKPPKKPGAVKRLAHTAGHGAHSFVHGKLYEVEHENVGTEGAHRSELAAESVYRFDRRKLARPPGEHPAKAVERAESKTYQGHRIITTARPWRNTRKCRRAARCPGICKSRRSSASTQSRRGRLPGRPPRPPRVRRPSRAS